MLNRIELQGTVANLRLERDEAHPSCDHQYFDLVFEGGLCTDNIQVVDWSNAKVKDGDKVIVAGSIMSNEKNIKDGFTDYKDWWIMIYGTQNDQYVTVLA